MSGLQLAVCGLLIVASTSLFGLLSLWAATSRRYWFLRVAVVAAALGLLLWIPAYELVVCFGLQAVVVVAAIGTRRRLLRWQRRKNRCHVGVGNGSNRIARGPRFSLQTLLLVTILAAALAAVGVRLPKLEPIAWAIVAVMGLQAATQSLCAVWLIRGRARWWWRVPLAVVAAPVLLMSLAYAITWLVTEFGKSSSGLPLVPQPFGRHVDMLLGMRMPLFFLAGGQDVWMWGDSLGTSLGIVLLTALLVWLFWLARFGRRMASWEKTPLAVAVRRQRLTLRFGARLAIIVLTTGMLVPLTAAYWRMVHLTPIPEVILPNPNGYDDLLKAGQILENTILVDFDIATQAALKTEVAKQQNAFAMVRRSLLRDSVRPQRYDSDNATVWDNRQSFRSLARALCYEGLLAELEGRPGDAVRNYNNIVRLGQVVSRGGLLIDMAIGTYVGSYGTGGLWRMRDKLTPSQCRTAVKTLLEADADLEPLETFVWRNRIFNEHALGWQGRLSLLLLDDLIGNPDRQSYSDYARWHRASLRLLAAELAVRAYRTDKGVSPEVWSDLVPAYLPAAPIDPFSKEPLVFRRTEDGYLLYSVGQDGKDDGGVRLDEYEYFGEEPGDLFPEILLERLSWPIAGENEDNAGVDSSSR